MDFKELSPAFLTSLAAIFVGAVMVGASSTLITVIGWLLILGGIGLNVFATLISIQQAKGAPLPFLAQHDTEEGETAAQVELAEEPEPDTESQPIIVEEKKPEADESIFRSKGRKPALSKR